MKDNRIKNVAENIHLPQDARTRIRNVCLDYSAKPEKHREGITMRFGARIAIVAACVVALSVSAYAMAETMNFSFTREDDSIIIGASLSNEIKSEAVTEPVRAWNAGEGEISVKLSFGYMPEDMSEQDNTPGKWNGTADYNRCITFSGFDLRITDLEAVIDGYDDAEHFMAGDNEAYLLTSDCEITAYNKELYVLYADEDFVVHGFVGEGISDEEIRAIAAGMTVEETEDTEHALPISNEGAVDRSSLPPVIDFSVKKIYESDLMSVGDTGSYSDIFDAWNITVEGVETVDSIAELDYGSFTSSGREKMEIFTDENGDFIPYKRTGVDREKGKFTETVDMTKQMVLVTVHFESDTIKTADDVKANLHGFILGVLAYEEDGSVRMDRSGSECVIDRTPGRYAGTNEAIYRQDLGDGRWMIGYILDKDECDAELIYGNSTAELYYLFDK